MFDKLINLLEEKISVLDQKRRDEEHKIEEIRQLHKVIRTIKNNPFGLAELNDEQASYVVNALGLGDSYYETIKKYKVIYEAYLQFGRDVIPQIEVVEEFLDDINKRLDNRSTTLTDEVVEHQYTIIQHEEHSRLMDELREPEKIVSKMEVLFKILNESSLSTGEKNEILFYINSKNNSLFEKLSLEDSVVNTGDNNGLEEEIIAIENRLEEQFNPSALNSIKAVAKLLLDCKTQEELEDVIDEWKFAFGDESITKVVDALISLMDIETLTIKGLFDQDTPGYEEELANIETHIQFLREYKDSIEQVNDIENNSAVTEVSSNKVEQALAEYNDDPLSTPNIVLFLSDAINRDIKSIYDNETLEDVFLLIEQLKNDNVEDRSKMGGGTDLEKLKPKSKGKQARVVFVKLDSNIYGILHVSGKKGDTPKGWITTLEARRNNCDIDNLRKTINEPEVLEIYVNKTKEISAKLKSRVSALHNHNKETSVGGESKK
ncbi:MAG: hypothetical protein IJO43_02385 [Bacilli bacterium]|nr:hypothetical protein [Bacilli bacterium]